MTESASILNFFRSSSPDHLEIVWIASHSPSSLSHRITGRCAVDSLSLVAAGGVGYVGLRKHAIVGVSLLFVTTDSPNTRVASYNMHGSKLLR